jgi:thioredoxin reductase (NADPH)
LKESEIFDVVIVGGGPAGVAASIQLKRFGIEPVLIEKNKLGGSLLNAGLVENYLGFPHGIAGVDLVGLIEKHVKLNRIKTIFSEVELIGKGERYFEISLKGQKIFSKSVIAATGMIPKKLGLPIEDELYACKKLFYEIKEIPPDIRNKKFVIIGGGDAAFDGALTLSEKGNEVNIVCRGKPKCLPILKERAESNDRVEVYTGAEVKDIKRSKEKMQVKCEGGLIECDYLLVAIGKKRDVKIFENIVGKGEIAENESKGFFIAGDLKMKEFRQLGIAVGDGLLAAMKVKKYLGDGR